MTDTATPRNEAGPTPSEPRTRSTSGRVKWTISGPVTMHVDPQSGATVIEYEAEAAEPAALPADLRKNLRRALAHDTDEDTGDVWLHREDADRLAALLVAEPAALDAGLREALLDEDWLRFVSLAIKAPSLDVTEAWTVLRRAIETRLNLPAAEPAALDVDQMIAEAMCYQQTGIRWNSLQPQSHAWWLTEARKFRSLPSEPPRDPESER